MLILKTRIGHKGQYEEKLTKILQQEAGYVFVLPVHL